MFCEDIIMKWLGCSQENSHDRLNRLLLDASDSYETEAPTRPPPSNMECVHVQGGSCIPPPVPATFNGKGDICTGTVDAHSVCMG